jgi:acetate kinase
VAGLLVVNAGSSSLKLSLLDAGSDELLAAEEFAAPGADGDRRELEEALNGRFAGAEVVGHRIVHGGEEFTSAIRPA